MRAGEVGGAARCSRAAAARRRRPCKGTKQGPPQQATQAPSGTHVVGQKPSAPTRPTTAESEAKGGSVSRCKQQVAAGTRAVWQPTDAKRLQTQPQPASLQLHGPNHHPRSTHCPRRRAGGRLQDEGAGRQAGGSGTLAAWCIQLQRLWTRMAGRQPHSSTGTAQQQESARAASHSLMKQAAASRAVRGAGQEADGGRDQQREWRADASTGAMHTLLPCIHLHRATCSPTSSASQIHRCCAHPRRRRARGTRCGRGRGCGRSAGCGGAHGSKTPPAAERAAAGARHAVHSVQPRRGTCPVASQWVEEAVLLLTR